MSCKVKLACIKRRSIGSILRQFRNLYSHVTKYRAFNMLLTINSAFPLAVNTPRRFRKLSFFLFNL